MSYTWATTGIKTITVTVQNCGGSVQDTHQVVISAPVPACPNPLTGLSLAGPTSGYTGTVSPASGASASRTFSWDTPGFKTITVTAQNCGGSVTQYHTVQVQARPSPPLSLRRPCRPERCALAVFR